MQVDIRQVYVFEVYTTKASYFYIAHSSQSVQKQHFKLMNQYCERIFYYPSRIRFEYQQNKLSVSMKKDANDLFKLYKYQELPIYIGFKLPGQMVIIGSDYN